VRRGIARISGVVFRPILKEPVIIFRQYQIAL
jgi:hypothetical protein